jgi:hypothetical protein
MLRFISNLLFKKTMFKAPIKEEPVTIYNTPHLFLFKGTGFEKETRAFLDVLRASSTRGVSYVNSDSVLHEECNRDYEKHELCLRERSDSALRRLDHSIIIGAIDRPPIPEYSHIHPVSNFLIGNAEDLHVGSLRFCLDEKLPNFLERQRIRSQHNGWKYDDAEFEKWYASTRPGQYKPVHPKDKEITIPVTSVDETVAKIWSYLPLK